MLACTSNFNLSKSKSASRFGQEPPSSSTSRRGATVTVFASATIAKTANMGWDGMGWKGESGKGRDHGVVIAS